MFWRYPVAVICVALLLSPTACIRPYKSTVSQGSLLRYEDIARLEIGMTREQVVFLIGEPILKQPFEKSRWDYIYMSRIGYRKPVRKNLTLVFSGDKLAKIENGYAGHKTENPTEPPQEAPEETRY